MTEPVSESPTRLRARLLDTRGRHFFNAGRFEEALECYRASMREDPTYISGYMGAATSLAILGRYDEAAAIAEEVIAREPDNHAAYTTMANVLHRRGDAAAALPYYQRGIELCGPDHYMPFYDFACYWALEGNEEECARYLGEALRRKPRMNTKAATDPDFEKVRTQPWFQELVAFKKP